MPNLFVQIGNPFIKAILRSPLHGLLSRNVLLITFSGRKSGKSFTTPVNYVRDEQELVISSFKERAWWKNLRGGAPVAVRLQGQDLRGMAHASAAPEAVARDLLFLLQRTPALRNFLKIELAPDGQPRDPAAVTQAASARVIVRITDLRA